MLRSMFTVTVAVKLYSTVKCYGLLLLSSTLTEFSVFTVFYFTFLQCSAV